MESFDRWEFLIQKEVGSGGHRGNVMIPLPEQAKSLVGKKKLTNEIVVHWNVEKKNKYVILSSSGLRDEKYEDVKQSQIYDIDSLEDSGGRIRPPKGITHAWAASPQPGDRVFYLSHQQMINNSVSSVYLLTEEQMLSLLPRNRKNVSASIDSVFEVPGFDKS